MDKVAVIVPFYNTESYFRQCLDSLVNQDYENYEIYLIDDRGTDGSVEIANEFRRKYPSLIHIIQNDVNIGQGRSRMRAVNMTDASYIMFVDSDDYVSPDYVSQYMAENKENYDLLIGSFVRDDGKKLSNYSISNSDYTVLLYSVACCKAFKRSFLLQNHIDFSDSRKGEDIYFSLMCFACKPTYRIIPYIGYYYRVNPKSTTRSMNYENNFEQIIIEMFRRFRENCPSKAFTEEMNRKIEYTYIANMVNALVVYNRGCGIVKMREKMTCFTDDLKQNYPNYLTNQDMRIFRPIEVNRRIRMGVGTFYWCSKFRLSKLLFYTIALL